MKSYTDLEQSKKLAEILPHESADMVLWGKDFKYVYADIHAQEFMKGLEDRKMNYVHCWSLAALLDVLLDNYIDVNATIYYPNLMKTRDGRYMVIYNVSQYTSLCNNPVDACYEMIIKLHELNLL